MNCNRCVYQNKRYPNNCMLLQNKDITWECECSLEEYKKRLMAMIKYYKVKKEKAKNNLDETIYRQQIEKVNDELRLLNEI